MEKESKSLMTTALITLASPVTPLQEEEAMEVEARRFKKDIGFEDSIFFPLVPAFTREETQFQIHLKKNY
jgi:hypothetical protein